MWNRANLLEAGGAGVASPGRSGAALSEVVLLQGSLRSQNLATHFQRSVLDLPLSAAATLLDDWVDHVAVLAGTLGTRLTLTVVVGENVPEPHPRHRDPRVDLRIRRDPRPVRGTGGVLADVLLDPRGGSGDVLVAGGSHVLTCPLSGYFAELAAARADVAVWTDARRAPSGVYLLRRACLAQLPEHGFVDFKEQALGRLGRHGSVRAVTSPLPAPRTIRSPQDYVAAVFQRVHTDALGRTGVPVMVERGAKVHEKARLYSSVVLAGGVVESGAVVIESVVTPGMHVARDAVLVRQVLRRRAAERPVTASARLLGGGEGGRGGVMAGRVAAVRGMLKSLRGSLLG